MGRRIYVDLNDQEEADINGWVNKGRAEPDFANYPTRLVLGQRDRARFDQIESQFPDSGQPVPGPQVAEPNYGIPPNTFTSIGVDTVLRREDDQARVRSIDPQTVVAVPLLIPDKPWNQSMILSIGAAEYGVPPAVMQSCFSKLPADFRYPLGTSRAEGTSVLSLINVSVEHLNPGETIYFNIRLWSSDLGRVSTEHTHIVRIGGSWPR